MNGSDKLKKALPYGGLFLLIFIWGIFLLKNFSAHGLIADEYIYFNQKHLDLPYLDFLIYNPRDFFGHGPLLPLIHKILRNLPIIRIFHLFLCLGVPFVLWYESKKVTPSNIFLTGLFLFHPMVLAQGSLIYPEILQGVLAGLSFLLWKKENYRTLSLILLLNTLLRETSLIFTVTLGILHFRSLRFNKIWIFLPSLAFMAIHMILLFKTNGWNPGWVEYVPEDRKIEFNMMLFSLKWLFSSLGGHILLSFLFLFPLFQIPLVKAKWEKINHKSIFPFILLILFFGIMIGFDLKNGQKFNAWIWFHRTSHLGILGFAIFFLFGIFLQLQKTKEKDWYYWSSAFAFLLFFSWYQAHSARDLLPLFLFFILSMGGRNLFSLKTPQGIIPLLLVFIHILQFSNNRDKAFLKHSLSLLSPGQKAKVIENETRFLNRVKRIKVPITTIGEDLQYLTNPALSLKPITLQPEGSLYLSLNAKLGDFKKIDKGEALYLYKKD